MHKHQVYMIMHCEYLGMYREAEQTLQDAIKQMPTNPLFYYSLGVLMGRLNRLEVSWI